jgi:hypothetical protein
MRRGSINVGRYESVTKALKAVFDEASKLPESEQDALAAAIHAEIEADAAWEKLLLASGEALEILADEASAEHRSGRTQPLDPTER